MALKDITRPRQIIRKRSPLPALPAGTTPGGTEVGDPRIARLRWLIYALALLSSLLQSAIAPLLPSYAHRFQLGGVQIAALLAATGVAALVISLPAGALSDRFGARVLTLWSGWLIVVATLGQAFAPNFPVLLATRLVFGLGYGIVWTAALTWLARASGDETCLAGTITASGFGCIVGPAFAGFIAEYFGLAAPFVVATVLMVAVTLLLTAIDLEGASVVERTRILVSVRTAAADLKVLGATIAVTLAGASAALVTLVAPLELHGSGASEGSIGVAFSLAAVLFILGSAVTRRVGHRAVRLKTVLGAGLVLALVMSPASASAAPLFVVVMLCATSAVRSVLWAVGYPLGASGATQAGVGLGVVMGLLNLVWALASVVSPLLAGALVGPLGARGTFVVAQAVLGAGLAIGWLTFHMRVPVRHVRVRHL
ncbi:MAG: MFS transporter [Acidimicrobiales bacterium]